MKSVPNLEELLIVPGRDTPPSLSSMPSALAIFTCRPNSHPFQERHVYLDEPIKIGRSVARCRPAQNNATFDCKVLSRNHALVWFDHKTSKVMSRPCFTAFSFPLPPLRGVRYAGSQGLFPEAVESAFCVSELSWEFKSKWLNKRQRRYCY